MSEDYYDVLGVSTDADPAVIRAAYLALVRMHHPDAAADAAGRARAEQRTKDLNAAYSVLGDAKRRADYDRLRRRPRLVPIRPQPGGPRMALKPTGARRKGPSLQERRERLKRVQLVSVALAIGAVVLIFGAFTGVVGMLRPSLPKWTAAAAPAAADREGEADPADVPAEVMLPWPAAADGRQRVMGAAGYDLAFRPARAGEAPIVEVSTEHGAKLEVTGAADFGADQANLFGIGRLSGGRGPAVVIIAVPNGADCCVRLQVIYAARNRLQLAELGEVPAAIAERFPTDINGDGTREWLLPDTRFTAVFGPSSPPPPKVVRFEGGRFKDVSAAGEYREAYANHIASAQRLCTLGSRGACAAFVASAARLGKAEWAWDIMLRNYGRDSVHNAGSACETGSEEGGVLCAGETQDPFPAKLRKFLVDAGYVRSARDLELRGATSSEASRTDRR